MTSSVIYLFLRLLLVLTMIIGATACTSPNGGSSTGELKATHTPLGTRTYEEIEETIEQVIGTNPSLSPEDWQRLEDYVRSLEGKSVQWRGWVAAIHPSKQVIEQSGGAASYTGDFRIDLYMHNPNNVENTTTRASVMLRRLTYDQVIPLAKWGDPLQGDPQEVSFSGVIEAVLSDARHPLLIIEVSQFDVVTAR